MVNLRAVSAAALLFTLVACNRDDAATTEVTSAPMRGQMAAAANPIVTPVIPLAQPEATFIGTLADADKDFMTKAAQGGMFEIRAASEAATRAAAPAMKELAARISTDHTNANIELQQIAVRKGLQLPSELNKHHVKMVQKLTNDTGAKFDKAYAAALVSDHEDKVTLFEKAAKDAKDADLRAYAARTLPILETHLAMAKDAAAKTK